MPRAVSPSSILATTLFAGALLTGCQPEPANLLADVFQDHAVVQRDRPIAVWGTAAPGQAVVVSLNGVEQSVEAGDDGHWSLHLPARAAGGPYELVATAGSAEQRIDDVLVGDVWLCSGQSNMEFQLRYATNAWWELRQVDDPEVRLLKIPRRNSVTPEYGLPEGSHWAVSSSESAENFSAVCYFMARELRQYEDVPLGLIDVSWGGSIIQDWISPGRLRAAGGYADEFEVLEAYEQSPDEGVQRLAELTRQWAGERDPGEQSGWAAPSFDDSDWAQMVPDRFWEESGDEALVHFDGTLWYRKHFEATQQQADGVATVRLGPADDIDTTLINGVEVGMLSGWNTPREYSVPPGVLQDGDNVIAVRVIDTGGRGGLWGAHEEREIAFEDAPAIALDGPWRYRISAALAEAGSPPRAPWIGGSGIATIFNGMLHPLTPYGLAGIAWYQGESNVNEATEYLRLQTMLAEDLRAQFASPDIPFVLAQLTAFGAYQTAPGRSQWAELRDVQRLAAVADPRMGMAVITDVGDVHDIHPTQKRLVGERLAREVRHIVDHGASPPGGTTSPAPVSAVLDGDQVIVSVAAGYPPLQTVGSDRAVGFELCESAESCRYADAHVAGGRVIIDVPQDVSPLLVRFGWADAPLSNVFDSTMVPMTPFELEIGD